MNRLAQRAESFLVRLSAALENQGRLRFIFTTTGCALAVLAFLYAPRLCLWRGFHPTSFEWARALSFLQQCQHPGSAQVEPALRWRLLPAWIGHGLAGLHPLAPLTLAPAGIVALLIYAAFLFEREMARLTAFFAALLVATTSGLITPWDWLGLQDAWAWLGLLVVAFSPTPWKRALACLLGPWIDERFVIALPLALMISCRAASPRDRLRVFPLAALFLAPYLGCRLVALFHSAAPDQEFIGTTVAGFRAWAFFLPLGWWMAYRALWLAMLFALLKLAQWSYVFVAGLTLFLTGLVAGDISRSAADLLPLAIFGLITIHREWPEKAGRILAALFLVQVMLPYAHVVSTGVVPVNILPVELVRLWWWRTG
jgi:hypothetical protein